MAKLIVNCNKCGGRKLEVDPTAFMVWSAGQPACYNFRCPLCEGVSQHPADETVVQQLIEAGAFPVNILPEPATGPPIQWDDVLNFHESISQSPEIISLRLKEEAT